MKKPLRQAINSYFEDASLSHTQIRVLWRNMRNINSSKHRFFTIPVIVSTLVATIIGGMLIIISTNNFFVPADIHQTIADEVAYNHLKLRPLDINATQFSDIRYFFTHLDFSLVKSTLLQDTNLRLVGGRYCSLQNQEAAQLRLINPQGAFATLYEVPYDKTVHGKDIPSIAQGELPLELYARGLRVLIWREQGLLFASVSANLTL